MISPVIKSEELLFSRSLCEQSETGVELRYCRIFLAFNNQIIKNDCYFKYKNCI